MNSEKNLRNRQWLGEVADKQLMLAHFKRTFIDLGPDAGTLHCAHTYPGENRSAESLYTLRICRFESGTDPLKIHAAFDGIPAERTVDHHDILLGSYNAGNQVVNSNGIIHGGVSVIFHTHHIRIHRSRWEYGRLTENIYHYFPPASGALSCMAQALDILIHSPGPGREMRCRTLLHALMQQLYYELNLYADENIPEEKPLAQKLKFYIEHNFYRNINCSTICEELQLNRTYASKIFHDSYHVTMNDYLLNLRLEAARNLLTSQENLKIADIAAQCAFSEPAYFIKVFKKRFDCTPGEFRRRCSE